MRVIEVKKVKKGAETANTILKNFAEMVDAACLAGVSGYAIYTEVHTQHKSFWGWLLLYAGLAIALQAFILFIKALNKK